MPMLTDFVKINDRGQITIPKDIREQEGLRPDSLIRITDMTGTIFLSKIEEKSPEEAILESLQSMSLTMEDWKEIEKERDESDR